jgi:argininosuccinate lyase
VQHARTLRGELLALEKAARGSVPALPEEEDVHMAVEATLAARVGEAAAHLHTARSRNDQVALDLRMFVRERGRAALSHLAETSGALLDRVERERDVLLPAYTHRQRAQPVTAGFLLCAWTSALARAGEVLAFALDACDASPLGSGACSGTSLPIDRALTARLLGFARPTVNALDTVHDRDFALDFVWACARVGLACAQVAADVVDFSTSEFALVRLDGEISAGSSMMPQKKNPDVFELIRGKASPAIGDVATMLALVRGLPSGYNRDQQEDRGPLLGSARRVDVALRLLSAALPHVHFDGARGRAMLDEGFTQATDLAEALVRAGVPFREAYKAVGALVRTALDAGLRLRDVDPAHAAAIHPAFDATTLAVLDPARAAAAKESPGGTGPQSLTHQVSALRGKVTSLSERAGRYPSLDAIAKTIAEEPLP